MPKKSKRLNKKSKKYSGKSRKSTKRNNKFCNINSKSKRCKRAKKYSNLAASILIGSNQKYNV